MNYFAILKQDCPLHYFFPRARVPVKSRFSEGVIAGERYEEVYMIALEKLTPDQFEKVSRFANAQCDPSISLAQCQKEIRKRGLPLRGKHVVGVESDVPFFL